MSTSASRDAVQQSAALLSMRLADVLGLDGDERASAYYANLGL